MSFYKKRLINGRLTSIEHDSLLVSDAYIALINLLEDSHDVSVHFEVAVNKSKATGFDLILKAVPAADYVLNDDSILMMLWV